MFVVDVAIRCDGFILKYIKNNLNLDVKKIALVSCTHDDPDHIGGVLSLARSCQASSAIPHASKRPGLKLYQNPFGPVVKVATSIGEAFRARSRKMYLNRERNKRYPYIHNHLLGESAAGRFSSPKFRLVDGQDITGFAGWEVIHTPGHSWDSICFFHHPSRSLITGDTLLGSGQKGQLVQPSIFDNLAAQRQTLEKLRKLHPRTVYPGHGSVFSGDQILDHL